jgi:hypothetical protein
MRVSAYHPGHDELPAEVDHLLVVFSCEPFPTSHNLAIADAQIDSFNFRGREKNRARVF